MSSIKTSQLHDLTRERLVGSRSEHELIGLILSLKDTVLNQRRELARVQRDYDEKKIQYEAVRDKLERVASSEGQEDQPAEPEEWWYAGHNTLTSLTYVDTVSFRNVPLLHKDGEHLAWRGIARSGNDAKRKASAAWKQAFGVEVEL